MPSAEWVETLPGIVLALIDTPSAFIDDCAA